MTIRTVNKKTLLFPTKDTLFHMDKSQLDHQVNSLINSL
jgi:hypothetical protein